MGNQVVDDEYYRWLLDKINYDDTDFDEQLEILFNTEFTWEVANDDNRADDGIVLRSIFMSEENWSTRPLEDEGCNMLEMMVALAMRIENDIMWDGDRDRTPKWFWEMFRNLGLDNTGSALEDYDILERFMLRDYEFDGSGGLFPLGNYATTDQREVEIWYQAQSYMMKNFSC